MNAPLNFEIIGEIPSIELIRAGSGIRDVRRLRSTYGKGRWRKLKGLAKVRAADGNIHTAEVHWYEAHGIGRKELKFKLPFLD